MLFFEGDAELFLLAYGAAAFFLLAAAVAEVDFTFGGIFVIFLGVTRVAFF